MVGESHRGSPPFGGPRRRAGPRSGRGQKAGGPLEGRGRMASICCPAGALLARWTGGGRPPVRRDTLGWSPGGSFGLCAQYGRVAGPSWPRKNFGWREYRRQCKEIQRVSILGAQRLSGFRGCICLCSTGSRSALGKTTPKPGCCARGRIGPAHSKFGVRCQHHCPNPS